MRARAGTGWQYVMTDLSLILFMLTAAALRDAPPSHAAAGSLSVPAEGEPVAVWRGGDKAPALRTWLAETGGDPRMRLTIIAAPQAASQALVLASQSGRPVRIVLDPEASTSPYAALTYDRGMARPLLQEGGPVPAEEKLP